MLAGLNNLFPQLQRTLHVGWKILYLFLLVHFELKADTTHFGFPAERLGFVRCPANMTLFVEGSKLPKLGVRVCATPLC